VTIEEYRAHPALNFSAAKILASQTPAHFRQYVDGGGLEETVAMRMGTGVHDMLQGIPFRGAIKPTHHPDDPLDTWHGAKKWCKAWITEQTEPVFSAEEAEFTLGMRRSLEAHGLFSKIMELCPERERPVFAEYRGVQLKALLDMSGFDSQGNRFIADLKTTDNASPKKWVRKCADMQYNMQASWYSNVLALAENLSERLNFLFGVVESKPPHLVAIYSLPEEAWSQGQAMMDLAVDRYRECMESGVWEGYSNQIQCLEWPRWA
jgi:hypothetical protein